MAGPRSRCDRITRVHQAPDAHLRRSYYPAVIILFCGDHTILINEVEAIFYGPSREALIYYRRRYWLHDTPSDSFRRARQQ